MNLLLLESAEVADVVWISGRRAQHLRAVLRVEVGDTVRAGVIGGAVGSATVVAVDDRGVGVSLALEGPAPAPLPVDLILAVPRPKVLSRVLETAAAFAVRRIDLVNAWRVDKAYLASPRLSASDIAEHLRLGAEQGVTTHLPEVRLHPRLMTFFDEHHPRGGAPAGIGLCAHARGGGAAVVPIEGAWPAAAASVALAIGPEGGWIDRELATFVERGFALVSLGDAVLRVEAAVASALGQIGLLLRRGR